MHGLFFGAEGALVDGVCAENADVILAAVWLEDIIEEAEAYGAVVAVFELCFSVVGSFFKNFDLRNLNFCVYS